MDDEIEIEEHDILEHPQVKAVFPDLSKIQIQVHTAGDTFLDDTLEIEDFEEKEDNLEDGVTHLIVRNSHKQKEQSSEDISDGVPGVATENESEPVLISDSEGIDTQAMSDDNIDALDDNKSSQDKVDELETENEFIDEAQFLAANKLIDDVQGLTVNTLNEKECVTNGHGHDNDDEKQENDEAMDSENGDELVEVYLQLGDHQGNINDVNALENESSDLKNGDEIEPNEEYKGNEVNEADEDYEEDFQPIRIKEEIVFESDISSDYEEILPDRFSDGGESDIVHYNNKIILGSKPSPQTESSNLKLLIVILEDWGVHLSESPSYCSDCQTLFTTPNALDSHRMSAHSLLAPITNRALKSTTKAPMYAKNVSKKSTAKEISNSTYCNHCNVSFKDHTSLIKHLYELLPANKYPCKVCNAVFPSQTELMNHNAIHIKIEPRNILKPKKNSGNSLLRKMLSTEMKPITITSKATKRQYPIEEKASKNIKRNRVEIKSEPVEYKWKCIVCKDMFDSYSLARRHRTRHPHVVAGRFMLKRIPIKVTKVTTKAKITFEKEKSVKAKPFELIQTSALFQCMKCGLHFSSSCAANSHFTAKQCGDKHMWSCPVCKKKMRKNDKKYHEKQHELGNKIKIYKITKNTYERTLCRCLKCNLYFEYVLLKLHFGKCGKVASAKCKECNINIPRHKYLEHTQKHNLMKLKRKDFILIDYTVINEKKPAVTKTNDKTVKDFKFLLGKQVKSIKTEPDDKPKILNKLSFEKEKRKLAYCDYCKCFFNRTYKGTNNHITRKCAKRKGSICKFCGLRVFSKLLNTHLKLHSVNKLTLNDFTFYDYITRKPIVPPIPQFPSCDKCQIHFLNNIMISTHICGEDYDNCEVCGEKFENETLEIHLPLHQLSTKKKPSRAILPELIMKYESLNAIWNILFECCRCDLVTDLYDSAVEHSQAHIGKSPQPNTIKCYICNLKFDENCWAKHSELHSRMPINSKHFRILKYSPEELLDESWFRMFASLPEKETRQILDKSLFGTERSLKMVLVKNGLPEFTVYCCSECRVCCDSSTILDHASANCERYKQKCTECDLAFDSPLSLNNHQLLHDKGIKKDEFRIVRFVKIKNKTTKANQKQDVKVKHKKYVLYKCVECTVCLFMDINREYHVCAPKHFIVYCKTCQQNFTIRQATAHRARHKNQRDFRAKNIRVEDFVPIPEGENKPRRNNKPRKLKKKEAAKQTPSIDQNSVVPEQSHRDKLEPEKPEPTTKRRSSVECFESLVNLITDNKTRKSNRLSGGDTERTAKLYKCECGLHYTCLRSAQKHVDSCDTSEEISKENCSKCGLLFPTDLLVAHLCRHHSRSTQLCVEELRKSETENEQTPATPTETSKPMQTSAIKLYKCGECNVYFINQKSVYQHVLKHKPLDSKQFIECKLCRLQFRILSLHIHMKKHHEEEFRLDKVLVEEYQPMGGNKTPIIDIYLANERFENVQVSSSND